ncbi:MAG: MgtC/SapB family protein [Rhodovibrionaceae bacterium]
MQSFYDMVVNPVDVSFWAMIVRMTAATVCGGIIGLDRELRGKPAGLRTLMLVSLASSIFMIITFKLMQLSAEVYENVQPDPIRVIEAVITGIAFLGAGAIIQSRGNVRHMTTGATIWLAGSAGVACGAGYLVIAALTTLFGYVIVAVFGTLEGAFHERYGDGEKDGKSSADRKAKR